MSVTIPTDLCDCGDEPRRGLTARKHMTMCRYGIIEEWESYRPAEAAPPPLDGHPDDGHEHRFTCIRCGVDQPTLAAPPPLDGLREALAEAVWATSDAAEEGPWIDATEAQRRMTLEWVDATLEWADAIIERVPALREGETT